MPTIHALAAVHPKAHLAEDVVVGPFCQIEEGVTIGTGTVIESHVAIKRNTTLGARCYVAQGAILGGDPQDKGYKGEETFLVIGDDCVLREYVTVHRGSREGNVTRVGNKCYLMAYCHLGHDVTLHDSITMANGVGVSGHVTIETMANIGGMVGVHQYVRIGKYSMVGGLSKIVRDVPPFMLVEGIEQQVRDINAVGLRRLGVSAKDRLALHKAAKLLFKSQLGLTHALDIVRREVPHTAEVEYLIQFQERLFKGKSGRGDQP